MTTTRPTHQELAERMDGFGDDLAEIKRSIAELVALKGTVNEIQKDVAETREIVKAWEAVKTGGKFVKWLGAVIAAVAAIIVSFKGGFAMVFK